MSPSPPRRSPSRVRLQKLLAAAGVASRRGAEELLRAGRVAVNGEVAELGASADEAVDVVTVDGEAVAREPLAYWMLHKPAGVVTTVRDPQARRTVLDFLPPEAPRVRFFPVGRLDRDTEGLVLLTNDGGLAQTLLHPSYETEREYRVTVKGRLPASARARLEAGVDLEDGRTAPARVARPRYDAGSHRSHFGLVLVEGRNRQIRRSLEALGHPVVRLARVRMGPLRLGRLGRGAARELEDEERRALLAERERTRR